MTNIEMGREPLKGENGMAKLNRFTASVLAAEDVVPIVLEFEQPPVAVYKRLNPQADAQQYQAALSQAHKEFLEKLVSLGVKVELGKSSVVMAGPNGNTVVTMEHDFTHVFNGLGVLMPGRMVATVAKMAGVRTISLNRERVYLQLDHSSAFVGSPQIWERVDSAGRNIRGEGVTVAVIDTGVDWTHPAFGGYAEAPNEKVLHAVSLTGEPPIDNFGHGTHVAGIIAGDMEYKGTPRGDSQINGVAPKAKIMGYKVLSASGSGSATNIILAMEDAVQRGANVMNLSLGDSYGDPFSPESSAANNAMLAGVIVCIAAGNSGPGASTVGAPGAAHHVITVGASTDDGVAVLMAQIIRENEEPHSVEMRMMENSAALPTPAVEENFVACGMGVSAEEFPKEVSGRIALVQRGEVTFREKAINAQNAGAIACVIYNNRDGNFFGSLGEEDQMPAIPVVSISMADGQLMIESIGAQGAVSTAKLKLSPEAVPQPYRLAEFSSRGPNNDGWIKPEITAPGVDIYSATITQAAFPGGGMPDPSGYTSASGTSMATPHVAGAAALIRQAHPDWNSLQIKAALVNTAYPMPDQGSVMDQGNGAMQLLKAIDCRAILVTATDPISPTHAFGLLAHDGQMKTASAALTVLPLAADDQSTYKLSVEIAGKPEGLTAELSAGSAGCNGECMASFNLTITADGAVVADGAYSGAVVAEADWGALRLPFYVEVAKNAAAKPPEATAAPDQQQADQRKRVGGKPCC